MAGPFRLPRGGQIDRSRTLRFTFDGRQLTGHEGDTLASALLAAGISVVGRSFKFHRPRGVLTAGIEEPNALVTIGSGARREPNVRATMQPLLDGLSAVSQNRWPSLDFDLGRANDLCHRLLPAGFYNKTFIWPSWHTFEPLIRRMAGLGVAPDEPDPDRYTWRNAHCDVLVVGGGSAGLLAAWLAGRGGARVILLDADRKFGGAMNWDGDGNATDAPAATERLESALCDLAGLASVRLLSRTTAVGAYDHGLVTAVEQAPTPPRSATSWRERWWRIRARKVVLATGAIEQPLAFPFNDRPGIMLAGAIRQYLHRFAVAAGERIVVATNNDSAYRVALDLHAAGIAVPCLLDTRTEVARELVESLAALGIPVHRGAHILGTRGDGRIAALRFRAEGDTTVRDAACDAVAMSGGWNPVVHLYCQAGGRLRFDADHACLAPNGPALGIHPVGGAAAIFDPLATMAHVRSTLSNVLDELGLAAPAELPPWAGYQTARETCSTGALGYRGETDRQRTWIDFQHDVTVSDIDLAVRENLVSVEHVKRYTTVGMSLDQGKTSNLNALAVLAARTNRSIPEVGTTTFRPLFAPVTLGAIAGRNRGDSFRPTRLLPAHRHHEELGAHFDDYGSWRRPACYPKAGESAADAIARELHSVRNAAGLLDASPLGKFLVRGPDAGEFLNRIYANTVKNLQVGRVRYGLMLNEQGVVFDDGVCARLADDTFWVNTTSGGAGRIGGWFDEWLQGEWPGLQVVVTDVSSAFATVTVAGPASRDVLAQLDCDIDLSGAAFPHMQVRTGQLCGIPCRMLRVSFTGERSYEISVPAEFGASLWTALFDVGQPLGLVPFGLETLQIARTEKGYLHVGSDTDGGTVPRDIGFGPALAKKAGDFVGRRSLLLPENVRTDRLELVGLRCTGDPAAFKSGAHLLDQRLTKPPAVTAGYLTSACYSPTLKSHVGLGLLRNGSARRGETIFTIDGGRQSMAEVVNPTHYDPSGARLDD